MEREKSAARIEWIAAGVAIISLLPRLWIAATTWLNPDEAGYFLHSTGGNLAELYWNSLYTHHPPLLIFSLHVVREVSTSEFALRLAPAVAGSLAAWFAFRWLSCVWNRTAGMVALVMLAFAPLLLRLSAEARGYSLVLLAMAAYLYLQDLALERRSAIWMLAAGAPFAMGILAEYSMAMFAASVGVYFLIRAWVAKPPWSVLAAWALVQSGALALYGLLYVNQIQRMASKPTAAENRAGYLATSFPEDGANLFAYAMGAALKQFDYFMGSAWLGALGACLFAAGLILLWRAGGRSRAVAILLVMPFVFCLAANVAGYFPFGSTRHTSFLGLFVAAGIGVTGERLLRGRRRWQWAAVLVIPLWVTLLFQPHVSVAWDRHERSKMLAALDDARSAVRDGGPVLCDQATAWILEYYLPGANLAYREFDYTSKQQVSRDLELLVAESNAGHRSFWFVDSGWTILDFAVGDTVGEQRVVERRDSGGALRVFRLEKSD